MVIIISLVFFYLSKLAFSGFLQFIDILHVAKKLKIQGLSFLSWKAMLRETVSVFTATGCVLGTKKKISKKIQSARNHFGSTSFIYDVFLCLSQSHKMAWPFLEPVNADEVPEYYDVITDPIGESPKRRRVWNGSKRFVTCFVFSCDFKSSNKVEE